MKEENKVFRPKGDIGIRNISAVHEQLQALERAGGDFDVDLSEVTGCDAAFAQLLYATRKAGEEQGRALRLCNASPAVLTIWRELGMDEAGVFTSLQ